MYGNRNINPTIAKAYNLSEKMKIDLWNWT